MTRSKTTESLVSALVIVLVTLLLILARATAHGRSPGPPRPAEVATSHDTGTSVYQAPLPRRAER